LSEPAPPRVLISYSHDSAAYQERVLALADRLRADGIDAVIDRYVQSPPEGWPTWCEAEIRKADFVLMVCTETYLRRVNGTEEPGQGYGVLWEARLIKQHLYDSGSVSGKFVPVLLADGSTDHVPTPVKGASIHRVEAEAGYEALLRLLTDQPLTPTPPLGRRRELPPRQRQQVVEAPTAGEVPEKLPAAIATLPNPRVEDLFVGRLAERERLATALFPAVWNKAPGCRLGDGGRRQVVSGRPLLLGEHGALPGRLCQIGAKSRQSRKRDGVARHPARSAEIAGRRKRDTGRPAVEATDPRPYRECGQFRRRASGRRSGCGIARLRIGRQRPL